MSTVYIDPHILWVRALRKTTRTIGGCWIYRGATQSKGYACLASGKKGKTILGHRLAVLVRDGELTSLPIDHLCGVRPCINPAHLEVVTTAENNRRAREHKIKADAIIRDLFSDAAA